MHLVCGGVAKYHHSIHPPVRDFASHFIQSQSRRDGFFETANALYSIILVDPELSDSSEVVCSDKRQLE